MWSYPPFWYLNWESLVTFTECALIRQNTQDDESSHQSDENENRDQNIIFCDRCLFCDDKNCTGKNIEIPNPKNITEAARVRYQLQSSSIPCIACGHAGGYMKKLEDYGRFEISRAPRFSLPPEYSKPKKQLYDFIHVVCALWSPRFSFDANGRVFISDEIHQLVNLLRL